MSPFVQELAAYAAVAAALGFIVFWYARRRQRSCSSCAPVAPRIAGRRRLPVIGQANK